MDNELLRESAKAVQLKLSDLDRLSFQIRAGAATLVTAVAAFGEKQDLWTVGICVLIIAGFASIDRGMKDSMYRLFASSNYIEDAINQNSPDRFIDPHCDHDRSQVLYDRSRWRDYYSFFIVLSFIPASILAKFLCNLAFELLRAPGCGASKGLAFVIFGVLIIVGLGVIKLIASLIRRPR